MQRFLPAAKSGDAFNKVGTIKMLASRGLHVQNNKGVDVVILKTDSKSKFNFMREHIIKLQTTK